MKTQRQMVAAVFDLVMTKMSGAEYSATEVSRTRHRERARAHLVAVSSDLSSALQVIKFALENEIVTLAAVTEIGITAKETKRVAVAIRSAKTRAGWAVTEDGGDLRKMKKRAAEISRDLREEIGWADAMAIRSKRASGD